MMDRLTTETNITDALHDEGFALMCFLKLKQYEDTGLEPKQIRQLLLRVKRLVALVEALRKELSNVVGRLYREENRT